MAERRDVAVSLSLAGAVMIVCLSLCNQLILVVPSPPLSITVFQLALWATVESSDGTHQHFLLGAFEC